MNLCCMCNKEIKCPDPDHRWVYGDVNNGAILCPDCFQRVGESWMEIHQAPKPKEKPSIIERLKAIASGDSLKNCTYQIALAEQMAEDNRFVHDQLKDLIWLAEKVNIMLDVAIFDNNIPSYALVNRCTVRIIETELDKLFGKEKS